MTYAELIEVFHQYRTNKRSRGELEMAIALWQESQHDYR